MAYVPKFKTLFQILFRVQDPAKAEALWLEGTWLNDNNDPEGARMAFRHAALLDRKFGGAFYNYAALTERRFGAHPETLKAWEEYLHAAASDPRQSSDTQEKVRRHVAELRRQQTRTGEDSGGGEGGEG